MLRIPMLSFIIAFLIPEIAGAETVVRIPVDSILNTRSVTTLTDGKLVTWQVGIDGGGTGDGYLTLAAALFNGDKNPKALPDSGRIPANARHPEIVLNYSNADGAGNQTRYVRGAGDFSFRVPPAVYSRLFLYFTSAEGSSSLTFTLSYADSSREVVNVEMPDYYNDLKADDPVLFYVVKDLAKWNRQNRMAEPNHHNIDGVELHPAAGKTLVGVKVAKTAKGYLVFWGATGIATGPVALLAGGACAGGSAGAETARFIRMRGEGAADGIGFLRPGAKGSDGARNASNGEAIYSATGRNQPAAR